MVKKYIKLANINKRISPHSFRHTAVTLALDNGSSYRDVQNMTGHSDSRLVARYDRGDKLKNNATWKLPSIN
jgi:integrase/recombinase XerD